MYDHAFPYCYQKKSCMNCFDSYFLFIQYYHQHIFLTKIYFWILFISSNFTISFSFYFFVLQLFLPKNLSNFFNFFGIDNFFLLKFCFQILFLSKRFSITFVISFCSFQSFLQFLSFHIVTKKIAWIFWSYFLLYKLYH